MGLSKSQYAPYIVTISENTERRKFKIKRHEASCTQKTPCHAYFKFVWQILVQLRNPLLTLIQLKKGMELQD